MKLAVSLYLDLLWCISECRLEQALSQGPTPKCPLSGHCLHQHLHGQIPLRFVLIWSRRCLGPQPCHSQDKPSAPQWYDPQPFDLICICIFPILPLMHVLPKPSFWLCFLWSANALAVAFYLDNKESNTMSKPYSNTTFHVQHPPVVEPVSFKDRVYLMAKPCSMVSPCSRSWTQIHTIGLQV